MIQRFLSKLQMAENIFANYYQSYCNSYVISIKFLVDGSNDRLALVVLEAFPRVKNDILKDSPIFKEVIGKLPYDLQDLKEVISYCFDNFQKSEYHTLTPIVPYNVYSHLLKNGGVNAENFINVFEGCVMESNFSIMKDGFGLRISFLSKNTRIYHSYENPAV